MYKGVKVVKWCTAEQSLKDFSGCSTPTEGLNLGLGIAVLQSAAETQKLWRLRKAARLKSYLELNIFVNLYTKI
jgi:hypothetical protein